MPEMNLNFEIPEIKIQVSTVEFTCGQIKGVAGRNPTTGSWQSTSPTKNWEMEAFATLDEAQDYTVAQIKLAATKKAAQAALNQQLEMNLETPAPPPPFPSVTEEEDLRAQLQREHDRREDEAETRGMAGR